MLRKTLKLSTAALVLALFACATSANTESPPQQSQPQQKPPQKTKDIGFKVVVEQNNKNINAQNGVYNLEDQKFSISVNDVEERTINIFAYYSDEMGKKYSFPVEPKDTVIFYPATSLIDSADDNKEITLTINKEMQFNAVTPEKRTANNNTAVIKIKDIADTDDKFDGIIYLTIFIDFNDNNIIDENEVRNISLKINKSDNSVLFGAKIYVSTIGSRIKDINNYEYSNDYSYVRITSDMERQLFLLLFGRSNFNNINSNVNRIISTDYSKYNMYVVFSPITTEIEFNGNPYHYKGENKLIFDVRVNKGASYGKYVFCREYRVEKGKDTLEMWINNNGKLIKLKKHDL